MPCYRFASRRGPLFVKLAAPGALPMLEAEAAGLAELRKAQAARVPNVLASGVIEGASFSRSSGSP